MWWKCIVVLIGIALGYWAWFDRRFYGFGIAGSVLWACGVALCTYASIVGGVTFLTWVARYW